MKPPNIDYSDVTLHQPSGGFSRLDVGPYVIGIAITKEDGRQDPDEAGLAFEEFIRRAREALK